LCIMLIFILCWFLYFGVCIFGVCIWLLKCSEMYVTIPLSLAIWERYF
jgi:hypothetical protein